MSPDPGDLPSERRVTIGISIGLPEPHASLVQRARRSFGDAQADAIRTHVTLLPPTQLPQRSLAAVHDHLADVARRHPAFSITLSGTGSFRPVSPVVFIAVVDGAQECRTLAEDVRSGPLQRPLDFPYHPHVTVAHHVDDAALDAADSQMSTFRLTFPVAEFQLYTQDEAGAWQPVHRYQLEG